MKKHIKALQGLIDEFGYWSDEVFNFNNHLLGVVSYSAYQTIQGSVDRYGE